MQRSGTISTWNRNPADEEAMGAAHTPIWRHMIDVSVSDDLRDATVLDYGCNQGGFLRMLYDRHPFRAGVGLDIARAAEDVGFDSLWLVDHLQKVGVAWTDEAVGGETTDDPVDESLPVRRTHEDEGDPAHLAGLHQGEHLEQLVQRAEAAGEGHQRLRAHQKVHLAQREVVELEAQARRDVGVGCLLVGQHDVQPDALATDVVRAAVAGFDFGRFSEMTSVGAVVESAVWPPCICNQGDPLTMRPDAS